MNESGGAPDLANDDLADYADHSAAKKTDMPRSSINKQWETQKGATWKNLREIKKELYLHLRNISIYLSGQKKTLLTCSSPVNSELLFLNGLNHCAVANRPQALAQKLTNINMDHNRHTKCSPY